METFSEYLAEIDEPAHRKRMEDVLAWVKDCFPQLKSEIKWNQLMFTDHGTFIIEFSIAKKHLAAALNMQRLLIYLQDDIVKAGYDYTKQLIRIPWNRLWTIRCLREKIIDSNMKDKADCTMFWRNQ